MRQIFVFISVVLAILVLAQCRKEPSSWSTSWTAPLVRDTLRIADYVNDSTLGINTDQSIQVILERDLVDFDINDLLELPDTTIDQSFSINVLGISLSPGSTFIDDVKEHEFSLGGAALTEARISEGSARVTIKNPIAEGGIFNVELPGVTKDGVTFAQSEFVPGASGGVPSSKTFQLDLSGYSIDMTGESGDSYNLLQSKMTVTTDPNGSSVQVTNQDIFEFKVTFQGLKMEYGKGYFGQQTFSDTSLVDLEALNAVAGGNVNIENVDFDIILFNGVKAEARAKITKLASINYQDNVVELSHPYFNQALNINPALWDWQTLTPSERVFTFDQSTTNIISFIENLGNRYELGYSIELNPYGNTSGGMNELFRDSRIGVRLEANFPLVLGANNLTLRDTFEFSYEEKERLIEVQEGAFLLSTKNTFPYGGEIQLRLLDSEYNELDVIEQTDMVDPAPLNGSGDAHVLQDQETAIRLTAEEVLSLNDAAYIEVQVVFNSATNSNNVVYSNAAIEFLLRANFKLKVNL